MLPFHVFHAVASILYWEVYQFILGLLCCGHDKTFPSYPSISNNKQSSTLCWKYCPKPHSLVLFSALYLSVLFSGLLFFSLCSPLSLTRWTYQMPALQSPAQRMSTTASQWVHLPVLTPTHTQTTLTSGPPSRSPYCCHAMLWYRLSFFCFGLFKSFRHGVVVYV